MSCRLPLALCNTVYTSRCCHTPHKSLKALYLPAKHAYRPPGARNPFFMPCLTSTIHMEGMLCTGTAQSSHMCIRPAMTSRWRHLWGYILLYLANGCIYSHTGARNVFYRPNEHGPMKYETLRSQLGQIFQEFPANESIFGLFRPCFPPLLRNQ